MAVYLGFAEPVTPSVFHKSKLVLLYPNPMYCQVFLPTLEAVSCVWVKVKNRKKPTN